MTQHQRTILIVDDFPGNREAYRCYLLQDNRYIYRFLEEEDGESALQLCKQIQLDAILLNFALPDMDGLEFLSRLQTQMSSTQLPVVMLTERGDEAIAVQAIKGGAQDYLVKGKTTPERLCLAIDNVIKQTELNRQLERSEARNCTSVEALCQREEQMRLALQVANMGTWDWNILTNQITWSSHCEQLFGLPASTFNGTYEAFEACVYPEDRDSILPAVNQARLLKHDFHQEFRVVWTDESIHWLEAKGKFFYNEAGEAVRMLGTLMDISERKQTEQALRESEEQLRMALEAAQMGIWNWNLLTNQITWSSGHEQLFGMELGTFDGTYATFEARIHPEDLEALNQAVNHAIEERIDYHHEFRVVWSDQSVHWIEGKGRAFYNEAGQAIRMAGTVMDISKRQSALCDRQHSQQALQQQFEQQRLVMDMLERIRQSLNLNEILNTTVEEVRQFLHTDRTVVFRFEPDWKGTVVVESVGEQWLSILSTTIYDPCFGEHFIQPFKQGLITAKADIYNAGISPCHLELLNHFQVRANLVVPILQGENLWGLLIAHHCSSPRQWQQSEIDLLQQLATQVGIAIQQSTLFEQVQTELNERKRAQEALRQSEERFRVTLKNSPIAVFNQDVELCYIWVYNPPDVFDARAMVGRYEGEFLSYEDAQRLIAIKHQVLETGVGTREEIFITLGEEVRYYDLTVEPLRNRDGEIVGITCATMDISDRKQAENQILALNAQLEQRVLERTAQLSQINQQLFNEVLERQQAEIALQEHIAEVYDLYNNAPCGYHSLDSEGIFIRINDTELNWLGYTREEVIQKKKFTDLITPESLSVFQENFPKLKEQGFGGNLEFQMLRKDGTILPVSVRSTAIKDAAGNYVMSRSILIDISDRKQAEEERAKLIAILEATPDFISSSSFDGQILYFNRAARNILGLTQDQELTNFTIPKGHPDWAYEMLQNEGIPAAIRDGSWVGETAMLSHDGREIPLSQVIIAHKEANGNVKMLSTIARDITHQKQAQAILRETERRWRYLLENVRLVVVGLDNTGKVEFANSFFLQLTGYTQAEVLGKDWFEMFLPLSVQQQVHKIFQEVLEQEFHPHNQNPILTKSGEEKIIAWNNTQLRNLQGEVIGTMSIGEDITERHAIEKMKNEFISIVSHELRTPLTSIRGSLGMLATGALNNHPQRMQRMIEIAAIDTERLVRLVNDILDLERLESGKVTLIKEYCDAADLMMQSVEAMRSLAQKQNITLSVSPASVLVWASSDHIIQMLTNLLSNAIKFSPPNSTITLTAQPQTDYILFQVKDQGRGIPADKLETIFGRFQQVDSSDSREKGGTGLGLAICRSIIAQHGGQIWVQSVLGEGSTFCFTLPVSSDQG